MHAALIIIIVFVQLLCCQLLFVLYCGRVFISQDFLSTSRKCEVLFVFLTSYR